MGPGINWSFEFEEVVGLDFELVPARLLLIKVRVMGVGSCGQVAFGEYFFLFLFQLVGHVTVTLEQVFNALSAQKQLVLGLILVLTRGGYLVPVIVVVQDAIRHEGRLNLLFHQLNPREVLQPWVVFYLHDSALCSEPIHWLTLDHLCFENIITLFMKSAASSDQFGGTSSARICTCFAKIWSRISFLFLPLYGLLPNMSS
jgi:hypothetical protein